MTIQSARCELSNSRFNDIFRFFDLSLFVTLIAAVYFMLTVSVCYSELHFKIYEKHIHTHAVLYQRCESKTGASSAKHETGILILILIVHCVESQPSAISSMQLFL